MITFVGLKKRLEHNEWIIFAPNIIDRLRGLGPTNFEIHETALRHPDELKKVFELLYIINIGSKWEDKTRIYRLLYG